MNIGIYLRYSSENQRDNLSLSVQRDACSRFVAQQFAGASVVEFADEAQSGMQHDRAGYQALLDSARAGNLKAIVCYKYDRLGRSQIDQLLVLEELEERLGVEIHSATEPRDNVVRGILGVLAEFESRKLGQRLRDAGRQAVRDGWCFGRAPYGYRIERVRVGSSSRGRFVVYEPEAAVVRQVFADSAAGVSYARIVRGLNERGVLSPSGGLWGTTSVHDILCNEAYLGRMIRGRVDRREHRDGTCRNIERPRSEWVIREHAHDAIVDNDLWVRVQGRLAGAKLRPRTGRPPVYLLSGLLKCADCGSAVVCQSTTAKGRRYRKYACSKRRLGCSNKALLHAERAERALIGGIIGELDGLAEEALAIAEYVAGAARTDVKAEAELREVERKIARANRLLLELPDEGLEPLKAELARLVERRRSLRAMCTRRVRISAATLRADIDAEIARLKREISTDASARAVVAEVMKAGTLDSTGLVRVEGSLSCVKVGEADASRPLNATDFVIKFRLAG